MGSTAFLNGRVTLHAGDCLAVLPTLDENSIDSCVTDPPYHLTSIVKRFGKPDSAPAQFGTDGAFARASRGFMSKVWDGGDVAFRPETWAAVLRVLKPGAHLIAFGGTRTYHRLACAIEDAGFEVRDAIMWHYGSGFPKSHDVSKGIDRAAGAEREVVGLNPTFREDQEDAPSFTLQRNPFTTAPATDSARQWEGWGTALKPATEILVLARKPLSESTVAANVLKHGVGAINIDACRVSAAEKAWGSGNRDSYREMEGRADRQTERYGEPDKNPNARWPANVIHDGSAEVVEAFPETSRPPDGETKFTEGGARSWKNTSVAGINRIEHADSGSAARFFFSAKADSVDRAGSFHPTVKPLDLMQYLVRLVTPPKGVVLDPFSGTGTTGEAAWREGFNAVLIEREAEYIADIERRMSLCLAGPDERARESIKARLKGKPQDHGPLFGEAAA